MYVMVLDDGETYSAMDGCRILSVDQSLVNAYSGRDDMDEAIKDFCRGEGVTGVNLVTKFESRYDVLHT